MKKLSVILAVLLCFCFVGLACGEVWENTDDANNWFIGSNYAVGENWEVGATLTPTPTATAPPNVVSSPIGATEMLLTIIWLAFVMISIISREPLACFIAGVVSWIYGLDLGLIFLSDSAAWVFGVVGFCLVMFGFFMLILGLKLQGERKQSK